MPNYTSEPVSLIQQDGKLHPASIMVFVYKSTDTCTITIYGTGMSGDSATLATATLPDTSSAWLAYKIPLNAAPVAGVYYTLTNYENVTKIIGAQLISKASISVSDASGLQTAVAYDGSANRSISKPIPVIYQGREFVISNIIVTFKTDGNVPPTSYNDCPAIYIWGTSEGAGADYMPEALVGGYTAATGAKTYVPMATSGMAVSSYKYAANTIYSLSFPVASRHVEQVMWEVQNIDKVSQIYDIQLVFRNAVSIPDQYYAPSHFDEEVDIKTGSHKIAFTVGNEDSSVASLGTSFNATVKNSSGTTIATIAQSEFTYTSGTHLVEATCTLSPAPTVGDRLLITLPAGWMVTSTGKSSQEQQFYAVAIDSTV